MMLEVIASSATLPCRETPHRAFAIRPEIEQWT